MITAGANWFDRSFSFGTKTRVETPITPKVDGNVQNTAIVETTVETRTNFGKVVGALENSSRPLSGNELPALTNTTAVTTASVDTKVEVNTPVGAINGKPSVDQNGNTTVSGGFSVKPRPGLTVSSSGSQSSNGDQKITFSGSIGTGDTKGTASLSYTQNDQKGSSNVQLSVGGESKVGNTRYVTISFLKYTMGN